ncbi:MAG: adenosylcobinamide-GDP ribazoletransferase [Candidatus Thiodiazotropha sp.]
MSAGTTDIQDESHDSKEVKYKENNRYHPYISRQITRGWIGLNHSSILSLGTWVLISGGLHLDGLADSADAGQPYP